MRTATATMSKDQLDEAIAKLLDGFKKIAVACNSAKLVFTDVLPLYRDERHDLYGVAKIGGEGVFPVVYLGGMFTKLKGNSGKLWLCAETIIHELSHHEVSTQDHRYDKKLMAKKIEFPYATAIENADSWGYFSIDLAGYLSHSDRETALK